VKVSFRKLVRTVLPTPLAESLKALKRAALNQRAPEQVFGRIFAENRWNGTESISGPGSTLTATTAIRAELPQIIHEFGVTSILDVPCGDAFWIAGCLPSGVRYIGGDVVPHIVDTARRHRGSLGEFRVINLVEDVLPEADLLVVRDCLIHLPNKMVCAALANIRRSKIGLLLATTYPTTTENIDIEIGGFRSVNLMLPPFRLPRAARLVVESESTAQRVKAMGLWRVSQLPEGIS
jgi:hypothetical protein